MQEDIIGCWEGTDDSNHILKFYEEKNYLYNLHIEEQEGEKIGDWSNDSYFYEPGYNLVIFIDANYHLQVYQVLKLDEETLEWCWVKDLRDSIENTGDLDHVMDELGKIIGEVLNEADKGFDINPEYIETYRKISEDDFLNLLESLDLMFSLPWLGF